MSTATFKIHGLDCAEEVATLRKELGPMPGVEDLGFDILNARMTVTYANDRVTADDLVTAVKRAGMRAEPWRDSGGGAAEETNGTRKVWNLRTLLTSASGVLLVAGFITHAGMVGLVEVLRETGVTPWPARVLYLLAGIAGVWLVLPKAWLALRRFRPDMNLLMTAAVVGAIAVNQWLEAGTVAFLFALSILLESWSVGRARRAIAALMALTPPRARVIHGGEHEAEPAPRTVNLTLAPDARPDRPGQHPESSHEHMMDVADVEVGSTVVVKPAEKFPLDGRITKGQTSVNQAPITGESVPVTKNVGDEVFAGTINQHGAVEFVTTRPANDTTLARIIHMVGEAQSKRSPSEQWVERFARYYTPAVLALAVGVALVPPLLLGGAWAKWLYEGLVLLVIACPCALVISTPVSIVSALASAARNGVLVKGGLYMETPARLRAVALDKTGTLTRGQPAVQRVVPLSGHSERELLEIAAAIEARSEHPLARAVMAHAEASGVRAQPAEGFQIVHGKGATAVLDGRPVWIGSHRYLEERGQETPAMHDQLEALSSAGSSVVVIGNDEHVCGFIAVADSVRDNARDTVRQLKEAGIEHVVMLTGDNRGTAEAIARATGVDEVKAELLPEDKVKAIEELVARYGRVGMVGDGVNDAPAMARSTLGIAMGAAGTDAAIETADIALMSDDLSRLPWLIHHSRRTLGIIRQNIIGSLGVKAVFVALTLAGHASLWAAIAADTGMALLVVVNALRLLRDPGSRRGVVKPV